MMCTIANVVVQNINLSNVQLSGNTVGSVMVKIILQNNVSPKGK